MPTVRSRRVKLKKGTGFGTENYERLFTSDNGIRPYHVVNSVIVCLLTVGGTLLVSILGGYAFGRFNFVGKEVLFLLTLAILMVPYATILIALYVMLGWIGLQNSLLGLSLVLIMFQLPFSLFMMRNSLEAVPRSWRSRRSSTDAPVSGCCCG